jgi:hypothetical protein
MKICIIRFFADDGEYHQATLLVELAGYLAVLPQPTWVLFLH